MTGKHCSARNRRYVGAAVAFLAAVALILFYRMAVELTGHMPVCLFKWATGWSCPGCGSQRAFDSIMHGELWQALAFNYFLPLGVLYLLLLGAGYLWQDTPHGSTLYRRVTSPAVLLVLVALILAWTVVRNLYGV